MNAAMENALAELDRMGRDRSAREAAFAADPINIRLRELAAPSPVQNGGMLGALEVFHSLFSINNAKSRLAAALLRSRRAKPSAKRAMADEIVRLRREVIRRAKAASQIGHRTETNAGIASLKAQDKALHQPARWHRETTAQSFQAAE